MLKVLLLFVLLIAGIVVGPMIAGHQGYVLIQTDNYNIETSVTGLAIILILAMVVLFAIEWLLRRIFRTGAHTRGWFVGRKRRRARKQTEQALLKLAEGDYQQVEKLMAKNADHAEQPVVNYLLAAEAAQQRGDEARANQHLERAAELAGNDTIPVEITRVRLQLARNENHAARHGVDKLLEVARIVSDNGFTGCNQDNRLIKLCFPRQVPTPCLLLGIQSGKNLIARLMIFRRAKQTFR